jgi:hypothetical protein
VPRYYVLGEATPQRLTAGNLPWPCEVAICFEGVERPIGLGEAEGWGSAGGFFTAAEALGAQWQEHFVNANAEWLLPYIEQLAGSGTLDQTEVIGHFRRLHGREPDSYVHPGA